MVNNFEQIKNILTWETKDDFYFLQIIQRKKDATDEMKVSGCSNNSRLVKAYYVKSLDHLNFITPEVIQLCKVFNARAGINLNKRSFEKSALQNLKLVTDNIINKNYDKVYKTYSSAVGKFSHDSNKKWIIDLDGDDENSFDYVYNMNEVIYNIEPIGEKTICRVPSKNGSHLITSPFNLQKFKKEYPQTDVQKNNPTNLYIP
jgi:hypothetical protein